jgi:hypothetical protein
MQLRLLRHPLLYVFSECPPLYGDLEPGDTIYMDHQLLPRIVRGTEPWNLAPLYVVSVTDHVQPAKIELRCLDLRLVYCTWWSPLLTDIGMTDDLNGIPIIDQAGGWTTARAQIAFGERPGNDETFQAVAVNTPVIDGFGLLVQGGGDVNLLLNSAFSEGTGDVFTSWTTTTSGSAIAVSWALYTLIDATGYRRACTLATYATGEASYLSQTVSTVGGKKLYARVFYKNGGAVDDLVIRIQRSDDSTYWRESDGSWQAGAVDNPISPKSGVVGSNRWVSKQLDLSAATTNLTVSVGHFSAVYNGGQITQLQGVELLEMTADTGPYCRWRSPLPTKATAVTRLMDRVRIANDSAVRVLSPQTGFVKLTARLHWSHEDLVDSERKYVWCADFDEGDNTNFFRCFYIRVDETNGAWIFESSDVTAFTGAVLLTTTGTLPQAEDLLTIIGRWTESNELGLVGQALDLWVDEVKGVGVSAAGAPSILSSCGVYLGSTPNDGVSLTAGFDSHITDLTIGEHCPTDEELLRY